MESSTRSTLLARPTRSGGSTRSPPTSCTAPTSPPGWPKRFEKFAVDWLEAQTLDLLQLQLAHASDAGGSVVQIQLGDAPTAVARGHLATRRWRRCEGASGIAGAGYVCGYVGPIRTGANLARSNETAWYRAASDGPMNPLLERVTPGQGRRSHLASRRNRLTWGFVELMGLEPTTSCLQSR